MKYRAYAQHGFAFNKTDAQCAPLRLYLHSSASPYSFASATAFTPYRLSPKSRLNASASLICQSFFALNLPKKKRSIDGSSTNSNPPIKCLFRYSQATLSATNFICESVNTRLAGQGALTHFGEMLAAVVVALFDNVPRPFPYSAYQVYCCRQRSAGYSLCGICSKSVLRLCDSPSRLRAMR